MPGVVARLRSRQRELGRAPPVARVSPGSPAPRVQQSLAQRIEPEEAKYRSAVSARQWRGAANQLVVRNATIDERHCAPRRALHGRRKGKSRTEDDRVEQISLETDVGRDRSIVVRTRQRGNEVDMTGRASFEEAAARHLDHDLYDRSRDRVTVTWGR